MHWMNGMLTDTQNGTTSSRRVVTLLAFLLCAIAFIGNLFFQMKIEQFIFDSMSYIAMAGLGATVAEKFASKGPYTNYGSYDRTEQYQPCNCNRQDNDQQLHQ